ncbi:O-methylsterigmatocystin oxidoreductase [Fusarium oxysporum f. sp. albedinis]|nr:O-methylsterigmatocystin oxidoreductase [Fusarium oxysporum f. sp. albedinis]
MSSLARVSATAPVSKTKWRLCEGGTFKRPGSCKRADLGGFFFASKATHVSSILNKVTIDGLFWGHILQC